jgi:hypothetical protein
MDALTEQEEIRPLIFNYAFHFILFILIFVLHVVIYNKIYWISSTFLSLYLFGTYFGIFYFLYPLIPMLFIFLKYFKKKIIIYFKKFSLYILIISILLGILNSAVILINTINSKTFCRECPFNLSIDHLENDFQKYFGTNPNNDEIKDLCKSRRCILNSVEPNNEYPYNYLCNYDPNYEFAEDADTTYTRILPNKTEITTYNQLICTSVGINYDDEIQFKHQILDDYLHLCYYLSEFYYCQRFNQPQKTYNLELGTSCPETNYLFLLYILSVLIIIIDVVITMLPWGVEYVSLKRIILILETTRRKPNSNNSTAKSSSPSNNEESFKKEKTLIIISPLEEENINNINNINNNNIIRDSNNPLILINRNENKNNDHLTSSERPIINRISSDNNDNNQNVIFLHSKNKSQNEVNVATDVHGSILINNINARDRITLGNNNNKDANKENNKNS